MLWLVQQLARAAARVAHAAAAPTTRTSLWPPNQFSAQIRSHICGAIDVCVANQPAWRRYAALPGSNSSLEDAAEMRLCAAHVRHAELQSAAEGIWC